MRLAGLLWSIALVVSVLTGCAPLPRQEAGNVQPFQDVSLENQAIARIAGRHFNDSRVNVSCFNRHLLLTGEVPNDSIRQAVAEVAASVPDILGVSNELEIGGVGGILSNSSDNLITSKVRMRLVKAQVIDTNQIRIVTVNSTVYLMGVVSRRSAAAVADLASTTKDVQRVVKVFEYID